MYQQWSAGRHLLNKFAVNGVEYSFCVQVVKDDDSNWMYMPWVCTGDWQSLKPSIIIDMENATINTCDPHGSMTAEQWIATKIEIMNQYLNNYFKGVTPVTWNQQCEVVIQNLKIVTTGAIPIVA